MNDFAPGVNSYDEWSTLREVVLGVAEHYDYYHIDTSFKLFYFENVEPILSSGRFPQPYLPLPQQLVAELQEDLDGFAQALRAFGAIVLRPVTPTHAAGITTPFWSSRATPALNIRDQTLILGDTIIDTATHVRARYFENDYLKPILYRYFRSGSGWISMPKPVLSKESLDPSYYSETDYPMAALTHDPDSGVLEGLEYELIFDGAQCIRFGRDVLVNVANQNHQLGYDWLVRHFGSRYTFHRLFKMADNHIDSIIMPLRPGVLLLRSPEYRRFLPLPLQKWDAVYAPEVAEARFPDYGDQGFNLASKFIDMNVLSLDERTVVVNSLYPELIKLLQARRFEVVPVRHRHRRLFSGGFHCFTLDCVRDGAYESYFA